MFDCCYVDSTSSNYAHKFAVHFYIQIRLRIGMRDACILFAYDSYFRLQIFKAYLLDNHLI